MPLNIVEREILNSKLRKAIIAENKKDIDLLLTQGASIDFANEYVLNILINAITYRIITIVKRLLELGTKLETVNQIRLISAFTAHTSKEDVRLIKILLEAGLNVNAQDNDGLTALMAASLRDDDKLVKFLLRAGADVNLKSNKGVTALMFVLYNTNGFSEVMQLLLSAKADVNIKDDDGKTALIYAVEFGAEYWRKGKNILKEIVKLLLKAGSDTSVVDKFGKTALMYAIEKKYFEIIEILK